MLGTYINMFKQITLNLKAVAQIGFCIFVLLQFLDLHSSYLLSHGLRIEGMQTIDSRTFSTGRELATESNPVLSSSTSGFEFVLKLVLYKALVLIIWGYIFFKQIYARKPSSVSKGFIYLTFLLDALYAYVVFNNYFLISKASL